MRHVIDEMSGNVTLTGSVEEWKIMLSHANIYDRIKMLGGMSMYGLMNIADKNPAADWFASGDYVNETGRVILASVINEGMLEDVFVVRTIVTYLPDYTDCDLACAYCDPDADGDYQQDGAVVDYTIYYGVPEPSAFGTVIDGYNSEMWANLRDKSGYFRKGSGIFVGDMAEGNEDHIVYDYFQPWYPTPDGHRMIAATSIEVSRESGARLDWTPDLL